MTKQPTADTIEERVAEAVERRLRPILERLEQTPPPAAAPAPTPLDREPDERVVPLTEAAKLLGCHRTTALRYEHLGKLPARSMMGSRSGWLMSDIRSALKALPHAPRLRQKRAAAAN